MLDQIPVSVESVVQAVRAGIGWLGFTPAAGAATVVAIYAALLSRRTSLEVARFNRETQRDLALEAERRAQRRAEVERSLGIARGRPGKYKVLAAALGHSDLSSFRTLLDDLGPSVTQADPSLVSRSGEYGRALAAFGQIDAEGEQLVRTFNLAPSRGSSPASRVSALADQLEELLETLESTGRQYIEQPEFAQPSPRQASGVLRRS
jgi:hypothetical protein